MSTKESLVNGRPGMLDSDGHRHTIHPNEPKGKFKLRRQVVHFALLIFLLVLPWMKVGGHPMILIDILHRKFSFFGFLFFAQDTPILFLFAVTFVLMIALFTALFGRVWCGWTCPQTVFIEGIFRRIERLTEGKPEVRRKNDALPLNFDRGLRKTLKWILFSVFTLWVTHSLLALFMGKDEVLHIVGSSIGEHTTAFLFILITNLIFLFDFGWLREQFCMIACPYGKFQSVLQDEHTITVKYQAARGEPRRSASVPLMSAGDCVDCGKCVAACPTGIDIRMGSQLECIACCSCVDACNEVMSRLKRPEGLIGFYSEVGYETFAKRLLRPRIFIYATLLILFSSVSVYLLTHYEPFSAKFFKIKGEPFQIIQGPNGDDAITNGFRLELANKSDEPLEVTLTPHGDFKMQVIQQNVEQEVASGSIQTYPFFLRFQKSDVHLGNFDSEIDIKVTGKNSKKTWTHRESIHGVGPLSQI